MTVSRLEIVESISLAGQCVLAAAGSSAVRGLSGAVPGSGWG